MCCLFGLIDYQHRLTGKQRAKVTHALATASEARGTDATGIAYHSGGKLHVFKRPLPGHRIRFHIPEDAFVVMGHTRMATQGDARRNYNNHPFRARTGRTAFALAHNGVLYNDVQLRRTQHLPRTNIETDSFVAVQLLEQQDRLSFDTLAHMAEQVEGSFSFTILDDANNLYFVKGENPLCIYHDLEFGLYLYASTEEILHKAMTMLSFQPRRFDWIIVDCGDILQINSAGQQARAEFNSQKLWRRRWAFESFHLYDVPTDLPSTKRGIDNEYLRQLKTVGSYYGYAPGEIDSLLADGFSTDDVEQMLYYGELSLLR